MVRPRSFARHQVSRRGDGRAPRVVNHEQTIFSRGIAQRTISRRATDQAQRGVDCALGGRGGPVGNPRLHPAEPADGGAAHPDLAGSTAARHSTALRRHSGNGHRAGLRRRPDHAATSGCQARATPKGRRKSTACGERTGGLKGDFRAGPGTTRRSWIAESGRLPRSRSVSIRPRRPTPSVYQEMRRQRELRCCCGLRCSPVAGHGLPGRTPGRLRRRMQPHAGCEPLRGRRRPRPGRPRRSPGWHLPHP
jgi:hypothetical protein